VIVGYFLLNLSMVECRTNPYNFVRMLRRLTKVLNRELLHRSSLGNSYLGEMYKAWQVDPQSVSEQWHGFFKSYRPVEHQPEHAITTVS
jgi:hypothetical protein